MVSGESHKIYPAGKAGDVRLGPWPDDLGPGLDDLTLDEMLTADVRIG